MPEAPRSFRPRVPASAAPAEAIREQVGRVRRRTNAHAAQNALYLSGAGLLLGVSALVGLAFFLTRAGFALAVWALLLALGLVGARLLAATRRAWIPGDGAAASIDRRASLQERLATLASNEGTRSRLWSTLVRQNVALQPRWKPEILVPRAVPRTAWVFALALVTAFFVVRWSQGVLAAREEASRGGDAATEGAAVAAAEGASLGGAESWSEEDSRLAALLTALPDQIREAILGASAGPGRGGEMLARLPEGVVPPGGELRPGEGGRGEEVDPSMLPPSSGKASGESGDARGADGRMRPPPGGEPGDEPARGERPKELPRVESGKPRPGEEAKTGERSGGGAAGAGSGGDPDSLYGRADGGRRPSDRFELDLAGRGAEGAETEEEGDDAGGRPAARLAAEQRLDDAIRRAQVPPEYEGIVQRLFSRADAETTGAGTSLGAR